MLRRSLIASTVTLLCACAANTQNTAVIKDEQASASIAAQLVANGRIKVDKDTVGTLSAGAASSELARTVKVAKRSTGSWVGARTVTVMSDAMLPATFYETFKFNFDDAATRGSVSLGVVAERITRLSGVPVRVSTDVANPIPVTSSLATQAVAQNRQIAPLPMVSPAQSVPTVNAGQDRVVLSQGNEPPSYVQPIISLNSVDMHWNGSLASFLDHITSRLNLSWSYREGVVVIERYVTESFEFAAFGGSQDYKMNLTGTSGAGTGGAIMDVAETGKVEILTTIKASIDQMIKTTQGSSVLNLSTGRITVTAQKDIMSRLRELVRAEDASLKRQAQIQIDVYSVTSNNSDEQGVDWNLVFNRMSEAWGASFKSPTSLANVAAGSVGLNIIAGIAGSTASTEFGGTSAIVKLLNEVGGSAKVRPITMVALNRQWARKTNLNNNSYVSETTSSSSSGGTTGGQKTASITTGDKILVQPAILDNGEILLKFGISLTELISLLSVSSGTGASLSTVQTPNTSGIDDQSTVRLRAGEAMVVTGLSRKTATNNTRTLGEGVSVGVGGTQAQSFKREEFMIVVRAAQI